MFWGSPCPRLLALLVELQQLKERMGDTHEALFALDCELNGVTSDEAVFSLLSDATELLDLEGPHAAAE